MKAALGPAALILFALMCSVAVAQTLAGTSASSPNPTTAPPTTNMPVGIQGAVSSASKDGIAVTIQLSSSSEIPGSLVAIVEVKNANANKDLTIRSLAVTPYGRLSGVYAPQVVIAEGADEVTVSRLSTSRSFRVTFTARPPSLIEHVSFRSGPTDFVATLTYYLEDATAKTEDFVVSPVVITSSVYVFVGGLCGAILLVSFILASKVLKAAQSNALLGLMPHISSLSLKWALLYVAYAVNGLVVAILLVMLSAGLSAFQLPIAFRLQDFGGGVIVGLFSVTLGRFLTDKLSLT